MNVFNERSFIMKKRLIGLTLLGASLSAFAQNPTLMGSCVLKQNPQTRVVEVSYEMTGDDPVYVTLDITTNGVPITEVATLSGDITTAKNPVAIAPGGTRKQIYWDAKRDWNGNLTTQAVATVTGWFTNDPPSHLILLAKPEYVVIDLSAGQSAAPYLAHASSTPPNLSDPACKTTELWLRRIPAGTFMMGSPPEELGSESWRNREPQRQVTLTQDFYIGVFEVTQKQWELVMGSNPSVARGDTRPVESVTYNQIRGGTGENPPVNWPHTGTYVAPASFMGRLRAKTSGLMTFDLPTESQWEYACRAGTVTALNSGSNLTDTVTCPNVMEVARCKDNRNDGKGGFTAYVAHTEVGLYLPNAWGLYDMHGNVFELCRDWCYTDIALWSGLMGDTTDPQGPGSPSSGTQRVRRGTATGTPPSYDAHYYRSAFRAGATDSGSRNEDGFRVCILLSP